MEACWDICGLLCIREAKEEDGEKEMLHGPAKHRLAVTCKRFFRILEIIPVISNSWREAPNIHSELNFHKGSKISEFLKEESIFYRLKKLFFCSINT